MNDEPWRVICCTQGEIRQSGRSVWYEQSILLQCPQCFALVDHMARGLHEIWHKQGPPAPEGSS